MLRTTLQWVSVIDGSGTRVSHDLGTLPPPRRRLLTSRKIVPALLLAMILGSCGTTAESDADNIARNVPTNYRAAVATYLRKTLTNPDSVRDPEITDIKLGRHIDLGRSNSYFSPVPAVCVRMITRSIFGGDTITLGLVTFENGAVADMIGTYNHPPDCNNRRYEPFPEMLKPRAD